jgi:hypothetical protein
LPHDDSIADEDSGQCITHHEELSTACAWVCDGQQLLSISDAGVICSRRAPPSSDHPAHANGSDDDTLDGGLWLDADIALPPGVADAQCIATARSVPVAAIGFSSGVVVCVSIGAR